MVAEGKTMLEGFGNSVAPFEVLDYELKRQNGFDATIAFRQVTQPQCAAVTFLSQLRNQRGLAPRLDIFTANLKSSGELTGSVADFGDRNVDLLLVAEDGSVHKLTSMLRGIGDTKLFSLRMQPTNSGSAQPQLLLAIVSSRALEALRSAEPGTADQVFPQILNEALLTGQGLNVTATYFRSDK
jgi:hypothetical protein